jgi:site-specific recombinase
MELEGISNACRQKVMMKSPTTRTLAIEAMNSVAVSRFFSGLGGLLLFFTNLISWFGRNGKDGRN